jgi:hypothetical protein
MPNVYQVATRDTLNGLLQYLVEAASGGTPDPHLLTRGLPQGGLLSAVLRDDGAFDISIRDQQQPTQTRNPRTVDGEELLVIRLLLLAYPHIALSRTDKEPRPAKHYVTLFRNQIKLLRVLADAQSGEAVRQRDDHHNLRRGSLFKVTAPPSETTGRTWKGRVLVIATALDNRDKAEADHLPLSRAGYEWLLRQAFSLLDARCPIGEAR